MCDTRYLVVISDLHAGSSVALCPERHITDDGQTVLPSDAQRAIRAQWAVFWRDFVPHCVGKEPYSVLVNGDVTEGEHHRTKQLQDVAESAHVRAAIELLDPVREKCRRMFIVRGTEAHVGQSGCLEEAVAQALDCETAGGKNRSHWELWLELGPHLLHAAHHIGTTSSTSYEHSALSRELAANLLESAQWGNRPADIIIRSHRHRYSAATLPTHRGQAELIVTPAWQLRTAFAYKHVSMRLPQIGGLVLGYDQYGFFKRAMVWAPPRSGSIPLTREAAKRQISTGSSSAKSQRANPARA